MNRNMPMINMIGTGQRIMQLRCELGLTVRDLQRVFGFATPQAIYKWQQGVAMPTIDNMVVLSTLFDVPIDDILVLEESSSVVFSA